MSTSPNHSSEYPAAAGGLAAASHRGSAFHPSLPDSKASGTLTVGVAGLRFVTQVDGQSVGVEFPLHGLEAKLGGASNRLVFFSHGSQSEWSLYTSDLTILENPILTGDPLLGPKIAGIRSARRAGPMWLALVCGVLLALVVGLWMSKGTLVQGIASQVPVSAEVAMGDAAFGEVCRQSRLIEDPALKADLNKLAAPLLAVVKDRYEFRLHLIDDPEINAFAVPGGNVVVTSGLIAAAKSGEEVLGVLGHEVAHVKLRHSVRQLISSLGLFVVVQAVLGDASGVVAVIANGGTHLLTQSYSRDFEREADDAGFDYLVKAKIDPRGMLEFFKTIEKQEKESLGGNEGVSEALGFFSTHPGTRERIAHIEARLAEAAKAGQNVYEPIAFDFPAFQKAVRAAAQTPTTQPAAQQTTQPASNPVSQGAP